jgi:hypothetical protein
MGATKDNDPRKSKKDISNPCTSTALERDPHLPSTEECLDKPDGPQDLSKIFQAAQKRIGANRVELGGEAVATIKVMTDGECNSLSVRHAVETNGTGGGM